MCHVYYTRGLRFREDGLRLRAAGLIFACKRPYRNGIYTETILLIDSWSSQDALDIHHASPMMAETILLIDSWSSQDALDIHHASPMMAQIAALRKKYDLHMKAERYISADTPESENQFIRK